MIARFFFAPCLWLAAVYRPAAFAEDWPQFRGPERDGVWREAGMLKEFPADGLTVRWRTPVGQGHSSPIVADGRVFLTDLEVALEPEAKAWERVLCFDEKTGEPQWSHREPVRFPENFDPENPNGGPCATPIAEGGRVFALGVTGKLVCLEVETGEVIWRNDLAMEYDLIDPPNLTPCPLIEGDRLIVVIGGKPGACVVAFDTATGREVWRALDDPPRAFSSPIVIRAGEERQLIVWTPGGVTSLNPATGEPWWRETIATREDYAGASPVVDGDSLLVSGLMFQLDRDRPAASVVWPAKRTLAQRILSNTCMPLIRGGEVFGAKISGRLVCLDRQTGEQIWETDAVTLQQNYASIHLVPNGDSVLLFTDEGNLIRARLDRSGYHELSRIHLIDPTFLVNGRRVVWVPPAFANGCVFARNDRELICASLVDLP